MIAFPLLTYCVGRQNKNPQNIQDKIIEHFTNEFGTQIEFDWAPHTPKTEDERNQLYFTVTQTKDERVSQSYLCQINKEGLVFEKIDSIPVS